MGRGGGSVVGGEGGKRVGGGRRLGDKGPEGVVGMGEKGDGVREVEMALLGEMALGGCGTVVVWSATCE